ncbi:retrovirus-related pol polyprotein from transposon TNT 1-94 [Tanacetum coccineum]
MNLYGPMRIESINEKKYILFIVDGYSWLTWVKFLRTKDETPEFIIKFLKQVQVRLNAIVKNIRTDNGTKFVHQTLKTYYEDPQSVVSRTSATVALIPDDTTDTPSSTSINQNAPSASTAPTTEDTQAPVLHQDVEGQETPNAQSDNDPFANIFNSDPSCEESSSRDVIKSDLHPANQSFEHLRKWKMNHLLDNVIGDPSRPVSTRRQLQTDAM